MKIILEIKESKFNFFMDLIKNLDFIKLVETKKKPVETVVGKKGNSNESANNKIFSPLDYNKYKFHSRDLKFDRNEINERH